MPTFTERIKHVWNAFTSRDPTNEEMFRYSSDFVYGTSYSYRPDTIRKYTIGERSIIASINTRIAIDTAAIDIRHARLDDQDRYMDDIDSGLNNIFNQEANVDQTGRSFIQDIVMSMLDEGVVAIVPVDTSIAPHQSGGFDILTARTGKIVKWFPQHVRINVYNERTGRREDIVMHKRDVAIIENPFYAVMNEPNSTLQRLIRKLSLLDRIDEQNGAGKLDIIIQLPYVIKTKAREEEAERRRKDIEKQLEGSQYGVAYTDGTERITQLNRAVENQLPKQIEDLKNQLYSELSMTPNVLNGTADEAEMLNYYNRTIEPILSAITDETERKFLSKTARSQHQAVVFFRDPFRLVPINNMAELADKFTRNEIMTSNEIRSKIGLEPSSDPKADELRNSNLNPEETGGMNFESEEEALAALESQAAGASGAEETEE